ncbi:MAG: hypothetical protein BFD77_11195 [Pseudomonas sp. CO183]|nr:MAG: hypothetical protein BFD77_11195 [Pseudomonas sp. CO183]
MTSGKQESTRENTSHPISESDMRARQKAVDFAEASANLSGFKITEDMKRLGQRYITGEIDIDEFLAGSSGAALGHDQMSR